MKFRILIFLFFPFITFTSVNAQNKLEITPAGERLKSFYLSMDVENLWIAGHHVDWETGNPDMPNSKHGNKTHCSAFIASVCKKLGIYILRPPEHGQLLLANAQYDWLDSDDAKKIGWRKLNANVEMYAQAQQLANTGKVVVAIYKNTDITEPGHAALVMPAERSLKLIENEGPEIIMAGTHNHNFISLKNGFHSHITEWPEHAIAFFVYNGVSTY